MAFISNKERNKKVSDLLKGNGGRKLFISISAILNCVFILFLIIALIGYASGNIYIPLFKPASGDVAASLDTWGIVAFAVAIVALLFDIISIIAVLTIPSSKKTVQKAAELVKAPLSGKVKSNNTVDERLQRVSKTKK